MELRLESLEEEDLDYDPNTAIETAEKEEEKKKAYYYFSREAFILPENERTIQLRKEKEALAEEKKRKEENEKLVELEEKMKRKEENEIKQKKLALEEYRKNKIERKIAEEIEEINDLDGGFLLLAKSFLNSKTNSTVSLDSIILKPVQTRLLFRLLGKNKSIHSLSVTRMNLEDEDFEILFSSLKSNNTLEHLDLEGNLVTNKCLDCIGDCLEINKNLRYLSLAGNNLGDNNIQQAFEHFTEKMKSNITLVYFSLVNTKINDEVLPYLMTITENNKNLIILDTSDNELNHNSLCKLQELLISNRKEYQLQRTFEFAERQGIRLQQTAGEALEDEFLNRDTEIKRILNEIDEKFNQKRFLLQKQLEHKKEEEAKLEKKLEKDTINRLTRKKKRPPKAN